MESTRRWIPAAARSALLLLTASSQTPAQVSPTAESDTAVDQFSIQVGRAYAPEVTAVIAEIGRPSERQIKPGDTFRSITLALCGHVDAVYVSAFVNENKIGPEAVTALELGRTYSFPACLQRSNAPYAVRDGEFPSQIFSDREIPFAAALVEKPDGRAQSPVSPNLLALLSGDQSSLSTDAIAAAGKGYTAGEAARTFSDSNPGLKSGELNKTGPSTIMVPEQRLFGVIRRRSQFSHAVARQRIAAVVESVPPAPKGTESHGEAKKAQKNMVSDVTLAELISGVDYTGPCAWPNGSPISIDDLRRARLENARLRKREPANVSVLIADTGYDPLLGVPAVNPERDIGFIKGYRRSTDGQLYSGFTPMDPDHHLDATPSSALPQRMHGSEVAATFLGGRFVPEIDRAHNPARIVFASLAQNDSLKAEAASLALSHAANNDIQIVNASFVGHSDSGPFIGALRTSNPALLLVTAAGNTPGKFPSIDVSWPGRLGGRLGDEMLPWAIVSVGAHGPDKQLLDFSRTGDGHVDILAPGCKIPTYSLDDNKKLLKVDQNGTSYAAPIVSMVAAEMAREGLEAYQIRNRLVYSVDIDRDLYGIVRSSGTLNLRKALSIHRDLVEVDEDDPTTKAHTTRLISGTLLNTPSSVICDGVPLLFSRMYKFASAGKRSDPSFGKRHFIWMRPDSDDGKGMVDRRCEPAEIEKGPKLKILNADTNKVECIALTNVVDFVARTFLAKHSSNPGAPPVDPAAPPELVSCPP